MSFPRKRESIRFYLDIRFRGYDFFKDLFIFSIFIIYCLAIISTAAEGRALYKLVEPDIAPQNEVHPTPTLESAVGTSEVKSSSLSSELYGQFLLNTGNSAFGGNIIIYDPYHFGETMGLSEDALEYKLGVGGLVGDIYSLFFSCGSALYFKEGSLFGFDPFIGISLTLNIYGTGSRFGGLGAGLYGGVQFGSAAVIIGYDSYKIERFQSAEGVFISASLRIN